MLIRMLNNGTKVIFFFNANEEPPSGLTITSGAFVMASTNGIGWLNEAVLTLPLAVFGKDASILFVLFMTIFKTSV